MEEEARAAADREAQRVEVRARLDADLARPAEVAALDHVRKMQAAGAPYEASVVALDLCQGLTPGARAAVADVAYGVGERLELPTAEPGEQADKRYRPDTGALAPELDVDDLFGDAGVVARRVREVAAEASVTRCMPAVAALAFASFACAARVRGVIRNRDGSAWRVFPNMFLAVEAVSGGKKSYIRRKMGGALFNDYATELRARYTKAKADDDLGRQVAAGVLGSFVKAEIAGKGFDANRVAAMQLRLEKTQTCVPNYLLSIPKSVEWYVQQLRASGFCALLPDEGKEAIKIFVSGSDGQSENCGALLSAHTVEGYAHGSFAGAGRGDDRLPFNVLCGGAFLPLQPSVLTPATPHEAQLLAAIQTRGLLARMLVSRPRLLSVPERQALRGQLDRGEIGREAEAEYERLVYDLLHSERDGEHPLAPAQPFERVFLPDANAAFLAFQANAEDSASPGGKYDKTPGNEFVRRQADHVARLAVVLSVLRDGKVCDGVVELRDVERACRTMTHYFLEHALMVAARTVLDPIGDDADRVWQLLAAVGTIHKRKLQQKLGAGWGKAKPGDRQSRIDAALEELAERGRIDVTMGERNARTIRVIRRCM